METKRNAISASNNVGTNSLGTKMHRVLFAFLVLSILSIWLQDKLIHIVRSERNLKTRRKVGTFTKQLISSSQVEESSSAKESNDLNDNTNKDELNNDEKNENLSESESKHQFYLAGMIRDGSKIQNRMWVSLLELNCRNQIGIHIIVKDGWSDARNKYRQIIIDRYPHFIAFDDEQSVDKEKQRCAPFNVEQQNNQEIFGNRTLTNRVDIISSLRDYQRSLLRPLVSYPEGVVALVDLDIREIPSKAFSEQIKKLLDKSYPHDVICAAGVTMAAKKQKWYYDLFATVFLPDTFVYPLSRRLQPSLYEGENIKMVRSDSRKGKINQGHIMRMIQKEAAKSKTGLMEVKSCFSGLAAYRATTYFEEKCQYQLAPDIIEANQHNHSSIMRYAGKKDQRPCEHVVFHDCLINEQSANIAIDPNLITLWKKD